MTYFRIFMVLIATCGLTACASTDAARGQSGTGLSQKYAAGYEKAWNTSLSVVENSGGEVVEANKNEGEILVSYGVTAFSWGERVGVFVKPINKNTTEIEVVSKRAIGANITAKDWGPKLHKQLEQVLASK